MIIRKWKFEDILKISELEKECFKSDCWSYTTFASCYENPAFYGVAAEDGGEVIGYGGITIAADSCDLENILVSEQFRRGGIGGNILDELIAYAAKKGVKEMFLEVRVSNYPAMKMYLSHGFVGVYARTRYYSDGEDCLVMKKILKSPRKALKKLVRAYA
jgi:ribosomal-protein-alanine N-acetyltransferase